VIRILIRLDLTKPGTRPNGVELSAALLPKKTISFLDGHYESIGALTPLLCWAQKFRAGLFEKSMTARVVIQKICITLFAHPAKPWRGVFFALSHNVLKKLRR